LSKGYLGLFPWRWSYTTTPQYVFIAWCFISTQATGNYYCCCYYYYYYYYYYTTTDAAAVWCLTPLFRIVNFSFRISK
jgi:hypothetical protein